MQALNVSLMMRRKQRTLWVRQMKVEVNHSDHHHYETQHCSTRHHSPCIKRQSQAVPSLMRFIYYLHHEWQPYQQIKVEKNRINKIVARQLPGRKPNKAFKKQLKNKFKKICPLERLVCKQTSTDIQNPCSHLQVLTENSFSVLRGVL